jgi:hypothetical protein
MSRRAMALPAAYCDRLAAAGDSLEAKAILDEAMRGLLREVQDLPNCVNAAEWEKFLEEGDNGEPSDRRKGLRKPERLAEGQNRAACRLAAENFAPGSPPRAFLEGARYPWYCPQPDKPG